MLSFLCTRVGGRGTESWLCIVRPLHVYPSASSTRYLLASALNHRPPPPPVLWFIWQQPPQHQHQQGSGPEVGPPRVWLSAAETHSRHAGLMEGALLAGKRVAEQVRIGISCDM